MNEKRIVLDQYNKTIGEVFINDTSKLNKYYKHIAANFQGSLKNEFFEILDEKGNKTGKIKLRDLVHKDGDWHGSFHLHIYTYENGIPFLLLQKRQHDKDIHPSKLDVVAAGHYALGETFQDGVREVHEEIGLEVDSSKLLLIGKRKEYDLQPELDIKNLELQDICIYFSDLPLQDYKLQISELAGIVKVNLFDFIDLLMKKKQKCTEVEARMFDSNGDLNNQLIDIEYNDIWPALFDHYYLKIALFVRMLYEGKKLPPNPFIYDVTYYF